MCAGNDADRHGTWSPTFMSHQRADNFSSRKERPFQNRILGTSRRRRRWHILRATDHGIAGLLMVLLLTLVSSARAALLNFENCLDASIVKSNPLQLQFVPLDVSVVFDLQEPLYTLNVTIYGNVSGTADRSSSYPSPDDLRWSNPNDTVGKITDLNTANNKYSTLLTDVDVVSFSPYNDASRFCDAVTQGGPCPLGPVFYANA